MMASTPAAAPIPSWRGASRRESVPGGRRRRDSEEAARLGCPAERRARERRTAEASTPEAATGDGRTGGLGSERSGSSSRVGDWGGDLRLFLSRGDEGGEYSNLNAPVLLLLLLL